MTRAGRASRRCRPGCTCSALAPRSCRRVPVSFLAFDVLLPRRRAAAVGSTYDERRAVLEELGLRRPALGDAARVRGRRSQPRWRCPGSRDSRGSIAKRRASTYTPGRRSRDWVKVKHVRMQEVVVGGWSPGGGSRTGRIGVAAAGRARRRRAGWSSPARGHRLLRCGPSTTSRRDWPRSSARPRRSPTRCRGRTPGTRTGSTPTLVGEVAFGEWTREGRLRHPTWRGLRPDKARGRGRAGGLISPRRGPDGEVEAAGPAQQVALAVRAAQRREQRPRWSSSSMPSATTAMSSARQSETTAADDRGAGGRLAHLGDERPVDLHEARRDVDEVLERGVARPRSRRSPAARRGRPACRARPARSASCRAARSRSARATRRAASSPTPRSERVRPARAAAHGRRGAPTC